MSKRYRLKLATFMVVRECTPLPKLFRTPEDAAEFAKTIVSATDDDKEHFWLVLLNTKLQYLMHHEVSVGTLSASLVHPREVFGPALREGAGAIFVFHNHPSGDVQPSAEDNELTRRLNTISDLVGIRLIDHIIVGNGTNLWMSMQQTGVI